MLHNSFSLKHLSMATGNFLTNCGQRVARLCLFTEVRYRISKNVVKILLDIYLLVPRALYLELIRRVERKKSLNSSWMLVADKHTLCCVINRIIRDHKIHTE